MTNLYPPAEWLLQSSQPSGFVLFFTVHMCTQEEEEQSAVDWPPSTKTLLLPSLTLALPQTTDDGVNAKPVASPQEVAPVSKRIMCCCDGGPWNQYSRSSSSTRACTLAASPLDSAAYNARTTSTFRDFSTSINSSFSCAPQFFLFFASSTVIIPTPPPPNAVYPHNYVCTQLSLSKLAKVVGVNHNNQSQLQFYHSFTLHVLCESFWLWLMAGSVF